MTTTKKLIAPGVVEGNWWHRIEDGRIQCDLCPRFCKLRNGQKGFCFVREAHNNKIVLTSYGRASGFCIDPIEKKPLNHFYPGTSVLSFGTAGCNLGCRFCQNWSISKAKKAEKLSDWAMPNEIVKIAKKYESQSIAYTYNDPVIFAEYLIDTARLAKEANINNVVVSAGYISQKARGEFFEYIDAANIDLKAFSNNFYKYLCAAKLSPVLETLIWLRNQTKIWFEITTLLIPGHNDAVKEIEGLCRWIISNLGDNIPIHFTAFHPDFKMRNLPPTSPDILLRAREQALDAGIKYPYVGNVWGTNGQSTYCSNCSNLLIERNWYNLGAWNLNGNGRCLYCGNPLAGHFKENPGDWGSQRFSVQI